jgi:anti-sigma B factor antagonist
MQEFSLSKTDLGGGMLLVEVKGYLDAHTFERLDELINCCLDDGHHKVIVKLAQVGYISSAGAGVFIGAVGKAKEKGGDIVLLQPSPNVREVFDLLGLSQIFMITDDLEAAKAGFAAAS